MWQCNAKFKGNKKCTTPHLYEEKIKELFIIALSKLITDRETLLEDGRLICHELLDTTVIDIECDNLVREIEDIAEITSRFINENTVPTINQDEGIGRYNSLAKRHEKLKNRYDTLQKKRERKLQQAEIMSGFLLAIKELDILNIQFNRALWHTTVDYVTVYPDERLVFHFKNGREVEVEM